jgi:ADP-ribose pyrophosphatase YjhB (NUDIX family)
MKTSAGIAILWRNKVLLAHATNASWFKTYGPPKGMMDPGEDANDTACREVYEEVGIQFRKEQLLAPVEVPYYDKNGRLMKTVILFPVKIKDLSEIGLSSEKVPLLQLQLSEVDDARFMAEDEFEARVMPRFHEPLKKLIAKYAGS